MESLGPIAWWSDFAGGDMPYYAATRCGLTVNTCVACDKAAGSQKLILRNNAPEKFIPDILGRNHHTCGRQPGLAYIRVGCHLNVSGEGVGKMSLHVQCCVNVARMVPHPNARSQYVQFKFEFALWSRQLWFQVIVSEIVLECAQSQHI